MPRITRTLAATTAALTAATLAATTMAPATAADHARASGKKDPRITSYALQAWGYGTGVQGGSLPAGVGPSGYESLGCTNKAGLTRTNHQAAVSLPGLGTVNGIATRAWTDRSGSTVSANATNTIGKVVLSDSPLGTLTIDAVSSTARAYHDASGFKTQTDTDLAKLSFTPPVGPPLTLQIPKPGRPVEIPGFGKVTIDHSHTATSATGARAFSNGLKVELYATKSIVRIGHAATIIGSGVTTGLFSGLSYSVGGTAAGDIVNLGRNPLLKMPCQGTAGTVRTRSLASINLGGQAIVGAATDDHRAQATKRRAWGYERSKVASLQLGSQLRIEGVVGQVNVSRSGTKLKKLKRSIAGTSVGRIYVNGQRQEFPDTGVLEIPGVAKIQPKVVQNLPNGIAVTALRITLLDGTGAVINLGNAQFKVRRAAR
jgi:hypothetical protein